VLRVVIDTSALVSAVLAGHSAPRRALESATAKFEVCTSVACLDELQRVLRRPKLDRYLPLQSRRAFFDLYATAVTVCDDPPEVVAALHPRCRDVDDDKFLALALAAAADVIVSSDADLLCLDPWNGVRVVSPMDFLAAYG
jgi:putative PIN family toxin of toxin-antitoxin system